MIRILLRFLFGRFLSQLLVWIFTVSITLFVGSYNFIDNIYTRNTSISFPFYIHITLFFTFYIFLYVEDLHFLYRLYFCGISTLMVL